MRELFVYYRVRETDAAAMGSAVQRMQSALRARHPGLTARVMRRPDAQDGQQTWMETYAVDATANAEGVDAALQSEIAAQARALLPWLVGPRHTEVFVVCQSARVISTCAMPASSNTGPAGTKPARA